MVVERAARRSRERQRLGVDLDVVGAHHMQGHRQACDRLGVAIAQQGAEVHGLAGTINATVRPQKGVVAGRRGATLDVEIRQIERRGIDLQPGEATAGLIGRHDLRGLAMLAAQEACRNGQTALGVRAIGAEHLVGAREQFHRDARLRHRALQRSRDDQHAGARLDGGQADIGDAEPLRRAGAVRLIGGSRQRRDGDVNAGREAFHQRVDRHGRGNLAVAHGCDLERSLEHLGGAVLHLRETIEVVPKPVIGQVVDHRPVVEAVEDDMRLGDVDALDGQADAFGERQHRFGRVERDARLAVRHRDLDGNGLAQHRRVDAGQAGFEGDLVRLAVAQATDAKVFAAHVDRMVERRLDGDKGVGHLSLLAAQRCREGEAGRRHGAVGLDRHVEVVDGRGRRGRQGQQGGCDAKAAAGGVRPKQRCKRKHGDTPAPNPRHSSGL